MTKDFDIPKGLSALARKAAQQIIKTAREVAGEDASGGGCRAFYTPAEWKARGEQYGRESLLIVVHDGGDLARFFNLDYEEYGSFDTMQAALEPLGVYAEACTSWYTAIYPA